MIVMSGQNELSTFSTLLIIINKKYRNKRKEYKTCVLLLEEKNF